MPSSKREQFDKPISRLLYSFYMNQTSDPTIKDVMEVVEFIRDNAATKDDIKNFATKDDLKNLATKDDLKNFATKDDLQNFATRDDLRNAKDEMIGHIDGFIKLHKDMDTEIAALKSSYQRHEDQISQIVRHLGLQLSAA